MAGNKSLNAAARARDDEWYTKLSDIERELRHYRKHFAGKIVLCNCDDPFESNFFKYFVLNFNRLKLKELIATCYAGSPIAGGQLDLSDFIDMKGWSEEKPKAVPYKAVVKTVYDKDGDGGIDMFDIQELFRSGENELVELKGDGDFRSEECIELLDYCDIVATNPPFSKFSEYLALLMEHNKKFVIIGNQNQTHYKDIFPLIQNNKIWLGYNHVKEFMRPDGSVKKFGNVLWFSNLDIKKHHEDIILVKKYDPERYKPYFNFDGIDVPKVSDIPRDYDGYMGVPDNFLEVFNPDQFTLVGLATEVPKTLKHKSYKAKGIITYETEEGEIVWQTKYTVPERKAGNSIRINDNGVPGDLPYSRVIIRNKHPEKPKEKKK